MVTVYVAVRHGVLETQHLRDTMLAGLEESNLTRGKRTQTGQRGR